MNIEFGKTAKRFIVAALVIVLLGGVAVGFAFRTQMGEAAALHQANERNFVSSVQLTQAEVGNNGETSQDSEANSKNSEEKQGVREEHGNEREHHELDFSKITLPTTGAKVALGLYGLLCALIGITYWLLITAWLYQAAEKSSMNGFAWSVLGLFFNLAAVLAFVLVRSQKVVCEHCGHRQNASFYCTACGERMKACDACGTFAGPSDNFCSLCGKSLKHDEPDKPE